jgi:hypothetical protein
MKQHVKTFFEESSIHGFRYIVSKDLHLMEKLLWIVVLLTSIICCSLLIFKIGVKVQEDAMVTYTSDTAIPVSTVSLLNLLLNFRVKENFLKVPFAAVTFCPDIYTYDPFFDYNPIVKGLKNQELSINNITDEEFDMRLL